MSEVTSQGPATPSLPELRFAFAISPGAGELVMPLGLAGELWPEPRFAPLPSTAPWLRGLVNIRGTLAPVYELAGSLGYGSPPVEEERVLMLGEGEERVGLVIHGDPRPATVARGTTAEAAAAPPRLAPFVSTCWLAEGGERFWELDLAAWIRHARQTSALGAEPNTVALRADLVKGPS